MRNACNTRSFRGPHRSTTFQIPYSGSPMQIALRLHLGSTPPTSHVPLLRYGLACKLANSMGAGLVVQAFVCR